MESLDVLHQRQELQKSKSIHELSKIGNVNEIPLPFKVPLPDIPLPNPTAIFKAMRGGRAKNAEEGPRETEPSDPGLSPPASPDTNTDTRDAEMLRCS